MSIFFKDKTLYKIVLANLISSIGSGITMIAVPWMLINGEQGDQIYGYVTLAMTLLLFIFTPYIGMLVDRLSRKLLLLAINGLGFILVGIFTIYGLLGFEYQTAIYISLFAIGSLYYAFFFPTIFAFGQEIFPENHYQALNGVLEVQSQVGTMISGALASLLITKLDLSYILLIDACTYLGGFIFLALIPYQPKIQARPSESFWIQLTAGYRYMKQFPVLFIFFTASFLAFIGVMVTNYLFPVFIAESLQADSTIYGMASMFYAIGASAAGLILPLLMNKIGKYGSILATFSIYTLALLSIVIFPWISIFLIMEIFLGFGNAGTRVSRNTLMMELVPNDKMGRVSSLFQVIGLGFRVTLIGAFSKTISETGPHFSLTILAGIMVIALLTVLATTRLLTQDRKKDSSLSVRALSK